MANNKALIVRADLRIIQIFSEIPDGWKKAEDEFSVLLNQIEDGLPLLQEMQERFTQSSDPPSHSVIEHDLAVAIRMKDTAKVKLEGISELASRMNIVAIRLRSKQKNQEVGTNSAE